MVKNKKLFGTDGVRGLANQYPMTVEMATALGRAAGKVFLRKDGLRRVVIGKDTRLSCYMLENALIAGLCSMGINTLMVGPLPTPGIAFLTRSYRADAGIMISASHNPYYDNGIKFFSPEGFKLFDHQEQEITDLVFNNDFQSAVPDSNKIGKNSKIFDANGRYIEFVKGTLPRRFMLKGLNVSLDCANGAAHRVAPMIFSELDATVHVYGNEPNGININAGCGSLYTDSLSKKVLENSSDVGVALDGDADRVILIDDLGAVVDGDAILAICANDMLKQGELRNNKIVGTVMSNYGFIKFMEKIGAEVIVSEVGDKHVIKDMLYHDANLGGEQSGHIVFLDHNTTGDGLVTAMQVLRIMSETGSKLSELRKIYKPYPQVLLNVAVKERIPLKELKGVTKKIEYVSKKLGDSGRVLVRYSGTESLCRVMVEGESGSDIASFATAIADEIKNVIGA